MHVTQILYYFCVQNFKIYKILKLHLYSIPYQVVSQFQKPITRVCSKSSKRLNQIEKNTIFKLDWIKEHPEEYQAHLERIADYLLADVWKEVPAGIEFEDVDGTWKKEISHFRTTTVAKEMERVKNCWKICESRDSVIPAYKIIDDNGKSTKISTLPELRPTPKIPEVSIDMNIGPPKIDGRLFPIFASTPSSTNLTPVHKPKASETTLSPIIPSSPIVNSIHAAATSFETKLPPTSTLTKKKCEGNTAKVLLKLLPDDENLIADYTTTKNKYKVSKQKTYLEANRELVAKLTVKLQIKYDDVWKELKDLEKASIEKSQSIDLHVEKEQHERLKRELGFFEKLKKNFFLTDPNV